MCEGLLENYSILVGFAKLTMICDPVFKLLRKNQLVEWNEECQKAFDKIKEYLTSPPVLKPPRQGKPLILYLALEENTMGQCWRKKDQKV